MASNHPDVRSQPVASADPWHYARPELAASYLKVFDIGLTSARGLFAKRRMGKSEFLEKDLIPAAQAAGYLTAYLNLWDARDNPLPALVGVLGKAMAPRGWAKFVQRLNTPLKKVKASGKVPGLAEGALEAELTDPSGQSAPPLSELLRGFDNPKKRLLLVLDEAQVLADPAHSNLAHSLRAGLDSRKQNIKVVFAGSSEPTLRRMFARSTEPFYNWAPLEPFELLGEDFVKAMTAKVNVLSKFPLSEKDALAAFEALQRTPEFFRRYLNRYITYAELGAPAALADTEEHVFSDANFLERWNKLVAIDQAVLQLLVHGVKDVQSEAARKELARLTKRPEPVGSHLPGQSLKRLQASDLVAKFDYGDYQLQDDAFAQWLRNRHPNPPLLKGPTKKKKA